MVRAERIELSSLAWKAGILAVIRRPHEVIIANNFYKSKTFLKKYPVYGNIVI